MLRALVTQGDIPVVLIDGPSGAGKSTLADALVDFWPIDAWPTGQRPTLIRLDDIYPGWEGLDAASEHLTEHVLAPRQAGEPAAWQRYDWVKKQPAEWHVVDATRPLIVEGCGTLARANVELSDVRVWLGADDRERKRRAIDRDGVTFADHWDQWQGEWEAYYARETPERWASIRLTSTPSDSPSPVWPGEY